MSGTAQSLGGSELISALVLVAALARPSDVGLSAARVGRIDTVVAESIEKAKLPGAVVLVG